jgi:predicted phage terminase large subunit-like protein
MMEAGTVIGPQPGQQTKILSTPADIGIFGGAFFGGKTYALLLEGTRHLNNPRCGPVFFRRTLPEIEQEGGAWDKSEEIFYGLGGRANLNKHKWYFPNGSTFTFAHLQHDKDVQKWLSSQIAVILMDQAEGFSAKMFWALVGRNRTDIGIRPYMRLGCNPDPDSWLAQFIAWWIDEETGFPIDARDGKIRYFVRDEGDTLHWADDPRSLREVSKSDPISVTFIRSKLEDNPAGRKADPDYEKRLDALPLIDRLRGKEGNWKVRAGIGLFKREDFLLQSDGPAVAVRVRWWDTAGSQGSGKYTAGVLLAKDQYNRVFVVDVVRKQLEGYRRDNLMRQTADLDRQTYGPVVQWKEQEPGGDGKKVAGDFIRLMQGHEAYTEPSTRDKVTRSGPWRSYVEAGNVFVLIRPWTQAFIDEHCAFPLSPYSDQVDAAASGYIKLSEMSVPIDTGIMTDPEPTLTESLPPEVWQ